MVLLCLLLALPAPAAEWHLATQPAQRVACTLTLKIDAPKLTATEWALVAMKPPELPSQTGATASLTPAPAGLQPAAKPTRDLSALKRPALFTRLPVRTTDQKRGLDLRYTAQATLHARRLTAGPAPAGAKPPTLSAEERGQALGVNTIVDHQDAAFRRWLTVQKLLKAEGEADLDFGRRVFAHIAEGFAYDYQDKLERRSSQVCKLGKSDCGGLSALFVATLRASGVPARVLIGRWANSSETGSKLNGIAYYQAHVKAEFFVAGVGWVPVDLASAVNAKAAERDPARFFGADPGDFLVFHVDHDVQIDSVLFGVKTIDGLQGVSYYAKGEGSFDGHTTKEKWEVKRLPPAAAGPRR